MRWVSLFCCILLTTSCDNLLGPEHEVTIRLDDPPSVDPGRPAGEAGRKLMIDLLETRLQAMGASFVKSESFSGEPRNLRIRYRGQFSERQLRRLLGTAGHLEFKLMATDRTFVSPDEARAAFSGILPVGVELTPSVTDDENPKNNWYALQSRAEMTDCNLKSSSVTEDTKGRPAVGFVFTNEAGGRFRRLTRENIKKRLAIVFNGKVLTAPTIESEIGSEGIIHGNLTQEEVETMVEQLKTGCMPLTPVILAMK